MRRRRVARRTGRRAARRTMRRRRVFRPAPMMYRRPMIRRPLGTMLILGATAGVAYKLGKKQSQQIQEYTGYPPDQLSEEDLQAAMTDLNIEPEPLDEQDQQEIAAAQAGSAPAPPQPAASQDDYIEELQKLAGLRDAGIITAEEFEAKKQQLLGL
jgi:hypothetical protein